MKAIVETKEMLKVLSACKFKNSVIPIIDCAKIEANDSGVTVTLTDLENFVSAKIPGKVIEAGETLIERKLLIEALKSSGELNVLIEAEKQVGKINNAIIPVYVKTNEEGEDATVFPLIPEIVDETPIMFSGYLIHEMKTAAAYTGTDILRIVCTGVYIGGDGKEINVCGTDAHRLFTSKIGASEKQFSAIVNKTGCKLLFDLAGNTFPAIEFSQNENYAKFTFENYEVYTRLIEGRYPNYNAVIPKTEDSKIEKPLEAKKWLKAIDKVKWAANKTVNRIEIDLTPHNTKFICNDVDYGKQAESVIDEPNEGKFKPLRIGFNYRFLSDMLKTTLTSDLKVYFHDANKAVVMKELSRTYLLMPVMLSE